MPWQAGRSVYSGIVSLATGNLNLSHHVVGWCCKGFPVSFDLYFNSQASGSTSMGAE